MSSRFPGIADLKEMPPEDVAVFAELLRQSFTMFVSYAFWLRRRARYRWTPIHKIIAATLHRVDLGLENRVILNAPPRMGKSESITILWVAWHFIRRPACRWMEISYSDTLIASQSLAIRQTLKLPEFRYLFPAVEFSPDQEAKGLWWTTEGGSLRVASSGGQITGFEAGDLDDLDDKGRYTFSGGIIISDPVKPDDYKSAVIMSAFNERYVHTISNRVNSPRTPIIVEAQRISNSDLSGFLLSGGGGCKWLHVRIPAKIDPDDQEKADRRYTKDWRFGRLVKLNLPDGYIWPEKYDETRDLELLEAAPEIRASQQMQNPSDTGGKILQTFWLRRFESFDVDTWPHPRVKRDGEVIKLKRLDIFADTASKTQTQHDYTVLQLWGLGEDGNIYLLDQLRGRWEMPELIRLSEGFLNRYADRKPRHYGWRTVHVEDASSGTGLVQFLRRIWGAHRIDGVKRSRDKVSRAFDAVIPLSTGRIWVPENAHWVPKFIDEMNEFTGDDSHDHDDQLDPMFDAVSVLLDGGGGKSIFDLV